MNADTIFALHRVRKVYGRKTVLDGVTLAFFRGAHIGVIGHNGSGKSTLLRVLAGEETEFEGTRWAADGVRIGYVPQEPALTPGTVRENLEEAVRDVKALLARYDELNERLAGDLEPDALQGVLDELERTQARIEATGAWELDRRLEQAAHALGLPPQDAPVGPLSGGERRRVALCKVLLQQPDALLLDEPTNHLDADAVFWLERHLKEYPGTVIAITHDRYFLDNVAQWMLEMHQGRGHPYQGNYSAYLEARLAREQEEDARSRSRQRLLDRELAWIRTNPKGRLAKNKARINNYERLFEEHAQQAREDGEITLVIPEGEKLGQKVLALDGVTKRFGDRTVIDGLTFEVPPGAVVGVIGPNGTGKTTLLKLIAGQIAPDGGRIELGPTVMPCFVDQDRAELDPSRSVFEEITDGQEELKLGRRRVNGRAYVANFNFRGTDQQQLVGTLSGGQRNRVQLAKMLRRGGNLLLVDEPTNDLDVGTIRVLEEAIQAFAGTAVVVSHDRFFLDRIATHILAFEPGGRARFWDGNYESYRERLAEEQGDLGERRGTHRRLGV